MVLPGEIEGHCQPVKCDCGEIMPLKVCRSMAGYYLGYSCPNCGPWSRETCYFGHSEKGRQNAEEALKDPTIFLRNNL